VKKVCCVGIAVADVVASPINVMPDKGKLVLVDSIRMVTGGCAVNAGIDLAKMGIDTSVCSLIGEDAFGDFIVNELKRWGVNISGIVRSSRSATSSSIVISDGDGERSFLHTIGANGVFSISDINWEMVHQSDIVFVGGALLMPQFDGEETKAFLKKVKSFGKITILDTAWDSTGRWMTLIEGCLPYVDYFMPSLEEATMLSGETEPQKMVTIFKEKGAKNVVIKMGEAGCYVAADGEVFEQPIYKVPVIDTNGAGDAFIAGFIAGLAQGYDIRASVLYGSAVGAYCVGAVGASSWEVSKEAIEDFIAIHD
jgi:sugar/nucleoside kinase (ribokinase family)